MNITSKEATFEEIIEKIEPVNMDLVPRARAHLDNLTKPVGSLGLLEEIAVKYCTITNTLKPRLGKKRVYSFAGDHGIVVERISCFPKETTKLMVLNMMNGGAGINVLCRHVGADLKVVDIGVDADFESNPNLIKKKVARGTKNIAEGPAMTKEQAVEAINVGVGLALSAYDEGCKMLGTGEMGIANTASSSALMAALLPCEVEEITGRGTGITDVQFERKLNAVNKAVEVNRGRFGDPLSALAAVGGYEIAGICGLCLGAAYCRIPVVIDGFISSAAALTAMRLCKSAAGYMFFSHLSKEMGHCRFTDRIGVRPILDLSLRLGEGTGAALGMSIIEAGVKIYTEMATFGSSDVPEGNVKD